MTARLDTEDILELYNRTVTCNGVRGSIGFVLYNLHALFYSIISTQTPDMKEFREEFGYPVLDEESIAEYRQAAESLNTLNQKLIAIAETGQGSPPAIEEASSALNHALAIYETLPREAERTAVIRSAMEILGIKKANAAVPVLTPEP